jgi:hypothetical protein
LHKSNFGGLAGASFDFSTCERIGVFEGIWTNERPKHHRHPRQTDNAVRRDGAALGSIGRARAVGLRETRSDGFLQLDINPLLNPAGGQAHQVRFGVAGRNLVADLESPSPQAGLNLRKGEFNAPAVHDLDLGGRGESWASCCANSFNSTWRSDLSGASARRALKGARFSGLMNFAISGPPSWCENYFSGRDALEIHPRQTVDFIGSSKAAVFMACRSYRHPKQPGNSNAQNSPCDPLAVTSTDAVSNRHLNGTRVSWFITHARVSGGSAIELSVTDECQERSGDGIY